VSSPGRTPAEVRQRLHRWVSVALSQPELLERITGTDNVPAPMSLSEFAQRVRTEHETTGQVVRMAGLRPDH
jgi:tripartite-type tricarboxylate transporter receptor subunit TctC